jgi:hypothetical protein
MCCSFSLSLRISPDVERAACLDSRFTEGNKNG